LGWLPPMKCNFQLVNAKKNIYGIFKMMSDICTTHVTTTFFFFLLDKNNRERKKKRENKNICEYERDDCFKSCKKIDVQISFLI